MPAKQPAKTSPKTATKKPTATPQPIELKSLQPHPLCDLVPGGMTEEEATGLREDIKENQMRQPIMLFQGKILDGRARYKAAMACGAEVKVEQFEGNEDDARQYVMSMNLQRRTLTGVQKAMAVADLYNRAVNSGGAKPSQNDLCKRYGISKATLSLCIQTLNSKNTMLITRVRRGEVLRSELEEQFYERTAKQQEAAEPVERDDSNVLPFPGARHPERRATETPASKVASAFKELTAEDRATFVELSWPQLSQPVAAFIEQQRKAGGNKKRKTG
jgi:ParB-like chromosome segregation protein Spo0J